MGKSEFLTYVKPLLKELIAKLKTHYEYVSVLAVDSYAKALSTSKAGNSVSDNALHCKNGFVLRVYKKGAYSEYSFNEISKDNLDEICNDVQNSTSTINLSEKFIVGEFPLFEEKEVKFSKEVDGVSMDELADSVILKGLNDIREKSFALSSKVLDTRVSYNYRVFSKLFLSDKKEMEQHIVWTNAALMVMGKKDDEIKEYYAGLSSYGGKGIWGKLEKALPKVVSGMEDLLDALPMTPGEYDCICTPEVTGMIAHEAFGHGVEEDMFAKDRALAKDFLGKYVASPLVTMHDGAAAYDECGSFFFDDEGVEGSDTIVIDKGILVSGINDELSAMRLGFKFTGNGRRESFERKAYTRMTNTYFEKGTSTVEEMIASIDYGFLLENPFSGMEDPKNWGIQLMVNMAREIKNGKLTGRVFSPIVMTGYVPDLLKSISMVSNEIELCGSGYCGKGYKEWVKVSDGGPYIKAKIRLG